MKVVAYIEDYGSQAFDVVVPCVYRETITEKLDSFSFSLAHLTTNLKLRPFQFVRVIDIEDNQIDKIMVIDNFDKSFVNLNGTIYYEYQINLMSPTKILEKVILPNRTILHSKLTTPKTIGKVIEEMCDLYMPRVKRTIDNETWAYLPLIDYTIVANDEKFNVNCPDLSWNTPSLREVLNTLMLVVGCLPRVVGYELSYIDLRQAKREFTIPTNKKFFVKTNNSSDSYINTLYTPLQNVLDEENTIVNEIICFRDVDNALLKQEENLVLTTDFPIESVKKLETSFPMELQVKVQVRPDNNIDIQHNQSGTATITNNTNNDILITRIKVVKPSSFVESEFKYSGDIVATQDITYQTTISANSSDTFGILSGSTLIIEVFYTMNSVDYIKSVPTPGDNSAITILQPAIPRFDITDFVYEKKQREQLEVDYTQVNDMTSVTRDTLIHNYYTTLSYTYGNNKIVGFSDKWDWFEWYGIREYVFIDALYQWLLNNNSASTEVCESVLEQFGYESYTQLNGTYIDYPDLTGLIGQNDISPYGLFNFYIEYRPFNLFTSKFHKEKEIPLELEQVDTQEASIPMFDEFSSREQEKANRLGNNIYYIVQPSAEYDELNDLENAQGLLEYNFDDTTIDIFQKETEYFSDFVDCNYAGSEHYIMQNYFTALQSKYRAYEYVDNSKATERKEITHTFVRVGRDLFRYGSDKVYCRNADFLGGIFAQTDNYKLNYAYEVADYSLGSDDTIYSGAFKKDVSIITNKNSIIVAYNDLDNAGYGTCIKNYEGFVPLDYQNNRSATFVRLGGLEQEWYIHQNFDDEHIVGFQHKTLIDEDINLTSATFLSDVMLNASLPLNPNYDAYYDIFYLRNQLTPITDESFFNRSGRVYYKSLDEKLNESVQFEYYTTEEDVVFGKYFNDLNILKGFGRYEIKGKWTNNTSDFNENWHSSSSLAILDIVNHTYETAQFAIIEIDATYTGYKYLIIQARDTITGKYADIFMFDYQKGNEFYFSLNDTKTDRVYALNETSQLYELSRKVELDSLIRELESVD